MGRYLDIVRRASEIAGGVCPYEKNEMNEESHSRQTDAYSEKFQTAIQKVISSDCPAGVIQWLREAYPVLYAELVDKLPDEIHRMWSERARLDEFERIFNVWVQAHRTACEMFESSTARDRETPKLEKLSG